MVFAATPPYDGTLARYYVLPGDLAYKVCIPLSRSSFFAYELDFKDTRQHVIGGWRYD
jgi:hypothetical protein